MSMILPYVSLVGLLRLLNSILSKLLVVRFIRFLLQFSVLLIKCYTLRERLRVYGGLLFLLLGGAIVFTFSFIFFLLCFCFSSARKGTIFDKIPYMIPLQTFSVDSPLAALSIVTVFWYGSKLLLSF